MDWMRKKMAERCVVPSVEEALPGRDQPVVVEEPNLVLGTAMSEPYPANIDVIHFGMGCFWGAERKFWSIEGVYTTAVGYMGGHTKNPSYEEVCSGKTGHTEVVLVAFDREKVTLNTLLETFWVSHDPTQGMRQGNDVGTQYRSAVYLTKASQEAGVSASAAAYQAALDAAGYGKITTEIVLGQAFYFAESYHQQYLFKNPEGYCGLGGTGVGCEL